MRSGDQLPAIGQDATIAEAILEITRTRCGGVGVVDQNDRLIGAFTDGDLRRALARADIHALVGRSHVALADVRGAGRPRPAKRCG